MPLDYNNSSPLYIQLKKKLEEKIFTREYTGKMPSEREIMDTFYVSRSTVRQAIKELENENILEKKPGIGTFIALKSIDDWLGNLGSTTETINNMGMEAGAKLIIASPVETPKQVQKELTEEEAFQIKRIRYADHIPIGVENSYYPLHIGKKLNEFNLNDTPLYDLLESRLNIQTKEAEQIIRAHVISKEDAELLQLPKSTTMLHVERKLYDRNNRFIEFEEAVYRADMYSFRINLARKFH